MTYRTSSLVSNICIHATSDAKQPIAIIFPHAANLASAIRAATATPLPDPASDIHLLCASPAVQDLLLNDLQALAKKANLKGIEVVQGVVFTPDEWTPESGLLTAAQKVQRKAIENAFKDQISVRLSIPLRPPIRGLSVVGARRVTRPVRGSRTSLRQLYDYGVELFYM